MDGWMGPVVPDIEELEGSGNGRPWVLVIDELDAGRFPTCERRHVSVILTQ